MAKVGAAREQPEKLRQLLVSMRKALQVRGEGLPADWPETASEEILAGRMHGWLMEADGPSSGLAILAVNRGRGFGQLHVTGPATHVRSAMEFVQAIDRGLPSDLRRVDMGTSAEPDETERAWGLLLESEPPAGTYRIVLRRAMRLDLDPLSPPGDPPLPPDFRFTDAPSVGAPRLAPVDFAAFEGGPDAGMVAESPEDNERLLAGLLDGDMGPPLREASPALLHRPRGVTQGEVRVVGFALHLEEASGSALLADIALLPEFRGRGLGRALLQRSLRGLAALGYRRSRLWVTDANALARKLYERTGYREERVGHILRWGAERLEGNAPSPS